MIPPRKNEIEILPSILSADPANLAADIQRVIEAGCRLFHVDVMDGHFVPNLTFGPHIVRGLAKSLDTDYDVHLMVTNPRDVIPWFKHPRTTCITIHVEPDPDVNSLIDAIHDTGAKAGLSVRPRTPIEAVLPYLDRIEQVLVMSVEPGFAGQSYLDSATEKIARLAQIVRFPDGRRRFQIQVDGGINPDTIRTAAGAGANSIVAGSIVFGDDDPPGMYRKLLKAAQDCGE